MKTKKEKNIDKNEFNDIVCDIASNIEFEQIDYKIYAIIEGKKYKLINNVIKLINHHYNVNDYLSQRRKLRRTDHLFGGRPKNAFIHRRSQAQPTDPFSQ